MSNLETNRFFPDEPNLTQLEAAFKLFRAIFMAVGKFGENFQYRVDLYSLHMSFDLQEGARLSIFISKQTSSSWAKIERPDESTSAEILDISEVKLGTDKETLHFITKDKVYLVNKSGDISQVPKHEAVREIPTKTTLEKIVDAMGRARALEEQVTQTTYDPHAKIERNMSLAEAGKIFATAMLAVDSTPIELETTPVLPLFDSDFTEETTKNAPAVQPESKHPDNTIRLKSGEVVGTEPTIKGGWHLPPPKNIPTPASV